MRATPSATSLAKPISCVTTTIVIPSTASCFITSSTSPTSSGSSAEVGSSKSISLGFIASALAIATRCCCPPESCAGYTSSFSPRPTRLSSSSASASASFFGRCCTITGASITFSIAVLCGKRLKRWKTIPMEDLCRATSRAFISCRALPFSR